MWRYNEQALGARAHLSHTLKFTTLSRQSQTCDQTRTRARVCYMPLLYATKLSHDLPLTGKQEKLPKSRPNYMQTKAAEHPRLSIRETLCALIRKPRLKVLPQTRNDPPLSGERLRKCNGSARGDKDAVKHQTFCELESAQS